MAARTIQRLQREIDANCLELTTMQRSFDGRIIKMINRGPELMDLDQVNAITGELQQAQDHYGATKRAQLRFSPPPTEEQWTSRLKNTETMVGKMRDLTRRLDECEEMFIKYRVPGIVEFSCTEAYELALRAFTRVWKEEAKERRAKGERSLIEWIQKLIESEDEDKRFTFDEMRGTAINIGNHISNNIGMYFMLAEVCVDEETLERKFREMSFMLERLRVEENSALIIDTLLLVVEYVKGEITKRRQEGHPVVVDKEEGSVFVREEAILLHQIHREALRFEVAFCCPDLPMMLINEVFLGMGNHMVQAFKKRSSRVSMKMLDIENKLIESIGDRGPDRFELATRVSNGVKEMWNNFELESN